MNNFKPVIILEPWGRRRPGLYADIPVPVLQVPAGEEGGPGGLPDLMKYREKKEDGEEKRKMMMTRRRWRGRGGMKRICRTA